MDPEDILQNWDRYVQSPAELASSRAKRFPDHAMERLVSILGFTPSCDVLEIGSGVGILSSHLDRYLTEGTVYALEPNVNFCTSDVPDTLRKPSSRNIIQGDGREIPLTDDSVDVVLSHTLLNTCAETIRNGIMKEMKRVVRPSGTVVSMDAVAGASWWPDYVQPAEEEEQERYDRFYSIHREIHEQINTGLYTTFNRTPAWFEESGVRNIETRGWFQPCRLSDDVWSEQQRIDLINLEHQANRDRLDNLRRLMEETGEWDPEYSDLFRQLAMDFQQKSFRRRKAFEQNRESGWSGGASLVVVGQI
ncbi:MAG: class I SAM-dependent methyltransferase [bacterium]